MRVLGIADTDSYLKWGTATLGRLPPDWEKSVILIETPFAPTEGQRRAAVDGLPSTDLKPEPLSLAAIIARVAEEQPDVVFLSLRGPLIRVVLRAVLGASVRRPVFVSGLPGISIPATRRALVFRSQVDLIVLHSKREIREFTLLAERGGLPQDFGLATLPFLRAAPSIGGPRSSKRDEIVFAVQAGVPRARVDRLAIVHWLAVCARLNPDLRVVLKLRALAGEPQTHVEFYPYDGLLAGLANRPENLVAEAGSMSAHLGRAIGLATVSSTALVEAVAVGIPVLALEDFGVDEQLINIVLEGSGLLGSAEDLMGARFRQPNPEWLDDNYLHAEAENDWIPRLESLVVARELGSLPLRRQRYGRIGGRLRQAWDRKRVLGGLDRSLVGYLALAIGYPARATFRAARRIRWLARRVLHRNAE